MEDIKRQKIGGYKRELSPAVEEVFFPRSESLANGDASTTHIEQSTVEVETSEEILNRTVAERFLGSLRVDVLISTFKRLLVKSGIPEENLNVEALEDLYINPLRQDSLAHYDPLRNYIAISTAGTLFAAARTELQEKGMISPEKLARMQLTYIHEMCHAFSETRVSATPLAHGREKLEGANGYSRMHSVVSGFDAQLPKRESGEILFEIFNEGVTERIAEEVFLKYMQTMGKSDLGERVIKSTNSHGNTESDTTTFDLYHLYMAFVGEICARIGEDAGIPEEVVWDAFKRGYFADPNLFATETSQLFEEVFDKEFIAELAALQSGSSDVGRVFSMFRKYNLSPARDFREKWLRHLGISPNEHVDA